MSQYRVCDRCGVSIPAHGWLNVQSFHLNVNIDLCERCVTEFVAWAKAEEDR